MKTDEEQILQLLTERITEGRTRYGPWRVDDGRDYPREALDEVIDALHYCAAALVRLRRERAAERVDQVCGCGVVYHTTFSACDDCLEVRLDAR